MSSRVPWSFVFLVAISNAVIPLFSPSPSLRPVCPFRFSILDKDRFSLLYQTMRYSFMGLCIDCPCQGFQLFECLERLLATFVCRLNFISSRKEPENEGKYLFQNIRAVLKFHNVSDETAAPVTNNNTIARQERNATTPATSSNVETFASKGHPRREREQMAT
jgi:hypothetical protein